MGFSADDAQFEQLKRNFSCKICFEPFSKGRRPPISLNCGHTFCARCVKQLASNDTTILCGLCRRGTYSDFRQLGKNVTLLDLLEHANLLAEDDPNEKEETAQIQPWRGVNHFLSNNSFTALLERHAFFCSAVHQFLSPTHWSQFDGPLDALRYSLSATEEQLRDAGDSFVSLERQLEQLESKFLRMISEQDHLRTRHTNRTQTRQRARQWEDDELIAFGNAVPSDFDSWGIEGTDEWDQSAWTNCEWEQSQLEHSMEPQQLMPLDSSPLRDAIPPHTVAQELPVPEVVIEIPAVATSATPTQTTVAKNENESSIVAGDDTAQPHLLMNPKHVVKLGTKFNGVVIRIGKSRQNRQNACQTETVANRST